jgi:hypothetical protein
MHFGIKGYLKSNRNHTIKYGPALHYGSVFFFLSMMYNHCKHVLNK